MAGHGIPIPTDVGNLWDQRLNLLACIMQDGVCEFITVRGGKEWLPGRRVSVELRQDLWPAS